MVFFSYFIFLSRALCFSRLLQMEVPERKPFSSNVVTTLCPATQSYLGKWILQRGPRFKDSTRSVTWGLQSRSPTQPTSRAHTSPPPSCACILLTTLLPTGRNVARTAGYEIRRYVFADRRPQYVFPLCFGLFFA